MLDFRPHDATKTELAREALKTRSNVRFVDRDEFCELLTSAKSLNRCDKPSARVRGICDPFVGYQYLIEEEKLFELDRRP
jgi:hypothetical protein